MPRESSEDVAKTIGLSGPSARARGWRMWGLSAAAFGAAIVMIMAFVPGGGKPSYRTEAVTRGDLDLRVTATGTLAPINQVEVGAETSGLITEILVDYNDEVEVGQVLARLDTEQLEATVTQREAALAQAEAHVAQAKATAAELRLRRSRTAELRRSGNTSQQALDLVNAELKRAVAAVAAADAEVALADAKLRLERSRLAKTVIRSPIDGIVLERLVEPGQTVAANFQTPRLFTLAEDLREMELIVDIDEADIGGVAAGQQATFTVDAYQGHEFTGEIVQIRNAPRESHGVVTYEGVLRVGNAQLRLKPGMTATASILMNQLDDVLLVPNQALRFSPPGQQTARMAVDPDGRRSGSVWGLGKNGEATALPVVLGQSDGRWTQLLDGVLSAGDEVIVNLAAMER